MNFYNEIDPFAAAWLRELIKAGHIAPGIVDERSIEDITPDELKDFTQCHFFAGIGGWPLAFRLAGWPDELPAWSGSCPCQPFSTANTNGRKGREDPRHLLPAFARLVSANGPEFVVGEQVSNAIGAGWLDELHDSLPDYRVGATIVSAKALGADHERKRLFWVANARGAGRERYLHYNRISESTQEALAVSRDCFSRARRLMDGDLGSLLLRDGIPVAVERSAAKGYGNAIIPAAGAAFIAAAVEALFED